MDEEKMGISLFRIVEVLINSVVVRTVLGFKKRVALHLLVTPMIMTTSAPLILPS